MEETLRQDKERWKDQFSKEDMVMMGGRKARLRTNTERRQCNRKKKYCIESVSVGHRSAFSENDGGREIMDRS